MRIFAVVAIVGLSMLLTGCPDNAEKSETAMPMEDAKTGMTSEMGMSEHMDGMKNMEGMDHMEGQKKMEAPAE